MQADTDRIGAVEVWIADDDGDMLEIGVLLAEDDEAAADGGRTQRMRPAGAIDDAFQRHRRIADLFQMGGTVRDVLEHLGRIDRQQRLQPCPQDSLLIGRLFCLLLVTVCLATDRVKCIGSLSGRLDPDSHQGGRQPGFTGQCNGSL